MKTSIIIVVIFGLLAAGCRPTLYVTETNKEQIEEKLNDYVQNEGVGAEIEVSLKDGGEISGELLSVRDSTITICTEYSATEEELAKLKYPINAVRNDEIQKVTIEGNSYVWIGVGIGILVGTAVGALVGLASSDDGYAGETELKGIGGGGIGFLVGAVAGGVIGSALSKDDIVLQEIPPVYDLSFLKPLARYPDKEPEYLRAIE